MASTLTLGLREFCSDLASHIRFGLGLLESRDPLVYQERQPSVATQELDVSLNPSSTTYGL